MHEASQHPFSEFITLTYRPDTLPTRWHNDVLVQGTLQKSDFQGFMKRLRERVGYKIRYYYCGEYGEKLNRPHYHAAVFGLKLHDRVLWAKRESGNLYTSELLEKTWGLGHCLTGDLTFDSAAYVARYITKKINGEMAESHYKGRLPEYTDMSRGGRGKGSGGIGYSWFKSHYRTDVYATDSVVMNGKEFSPPAYYDRQLELENDELFDKVKRMRRINAPDPVTDPEQSLERMATKERVALSQFNNKKRSYESE